MQWRIRQLAVTASTNDDVRAAAESGEVEGLVIHALRQEAGRGRQGRVWQSPIGNLYCSFLIRTELDPRIISQMSFVTALAIADTVSHFVPNHSVQVKWPNDVLVGRKKISGVLLEACEGYLVVGIGINVEHFPDNPLYPTTSLRDLGAGHTTVGDTLTVLLDAFSKHYDRFKAEGFDAVRTAWLTYAIKGKMTARLPHETVEGDFVDLDPHGRLHLRLADGTDRFIVTGDVFPVLVAPKPS